MIRRLLTAVLLLASIVASAPLWFPADLLWRLAAPTLPAGLQLNEIGGTAASGWALCSVTGGIESRIDWRLDPLALWQGQWLAQLHLTGNDHELQGELRFVEDRVTVDQLRGRLDQGTLNPLLAPYGVAVQGSLAVENVAFEVVDAWPSHLAAKLRWPGGIIEYQGATGLETYQVPLIEGRLGLLGSNLQLQLDDGAANRLMELLLTREGWLTTRVYGRLFSLIGQALPPGLTTEEVVFEVEQAVVLPGAQQPVGPG